MLSAINVYLCCWGRWGRRRRLVLMKHMWAGAWRSAADTQTPEASLRRTRTSNDMLWEGKKLNQSFEFNSELNQSSYYLVDFFFNQLTSCLFLNAWVISNLAGSERKLFLSYGSWGWYGMSQWSVSRVLRRHRGPLWPHWLAVPSQWRVFLNGSATFCP